MSFRVEKLTSSHNLSDFKSGKSSLDDYLKMYAFQNQKRGISTTYVALEGDKIIGYYALATASVRPEDAPLKIKRGLPSYEIPAMLLARLAVDTSFQGKGIGRGLLKDAILRILEVSKVVGVRLLLVHAKDEQAAKWYKKFDFEESPMNSRHLFLILKDVLGNFED